MKNDGPEEDTTPEQNDLQSRRDDASVQRHPKEDRESLRKVRKGEGQDEFAPRDVQGTEDTPLEVIQLRFVNYTPSAQTIPYRKRHYRPALVPSSELKEQLIDHLN